MNNKKLSLWERNQLPFITEDRVKERDDLKVSGKLFLEFIAEMNGETNWPFPSQCGEPSRSSLVYPSQPAGEVLDCFFPVTGHTHETFEILHYEIKKAGHQGNWKLVALHATFLGQLAVMLALHDIFVRPRLNARAFGSKGGKTKAARQARPRRIASEFVQKEWNDYRKRYPAARHFEAFWDMEAKEICKRLRRINRAAANTLRRGKYFFISPKLMSERIRKLETQSSNSGNLRNLNLN
jgi:hypothetical protein